jgi:hypothetical protein
VNPDQIAGKTVYRTCASSSCGMGSIVPIAFQAVIIAEKDFIAPLIEGCDLTEMNGFRLIPFTTIKSGGALPAFLADKTAIMDKGKWVETDNVYIAVTEKKIISGGYSALLGMPFFDAIEPQIKGGLTVK